ncbi:MAG: hypothetical protein HY619_05395 [Thaumarchaeota archaeon]|nr:hypothetical protein [Nitrososphaerota archaeon]
MGRTIPSFRIALEQEIETWKHYKKALSKGSRRNLEELFNAARNYCSAASNAVRPIRFQGMFMAIVAEHGMRLANIANETEKMRLEIHARD